MIAQTSLTKIFSKVVPVFVLQKVYLDINLQQDCIYH